MGVHQRVIAETVRSSESRESRPIRYTPLAQSAAWRAILDILKGSSGHNIVGTNYSGQLHASARETSYVPMATFASTMATVQAAPHREAGRNSSLGRRKLAVPVHETHG